MFPEGDSHGCISEVLKEKGQILEVGEGAWRQTQEARNHFFQTRFNYLFTATT